MGTEPGEGVDLAEEMALRLTGLLVKDQKGLRLNNRIYGEIFNHRWVEQALGKLRPYGEAIQQWLATGDEAYLLQGNPLQEALTWASDKKLSPEDYQFLNASRDAEKQELVRANQILEEARRKADQKIRWGTGILAASIVALLGAGLFSVWLAQQGVKKEQAAQAKLTAMEAQATSAQQQYRQAQERERVALAAEALAKENVAQAQTELKSAQAKTAEEQRKAAENLAQAQQQLNAAQNEIAAVERERSRLEREGSLIQFDQAAVKIQTQALQALTLQQTKPLELGGILKTLEIAPDLQELGQSSLKARPDYVAAQQQIQVTLLKSWYDLREKNRLLGHKGWVSSIAFSPDGTTLASGSADNTIKIWN
ncbi:MAG: WD40 repeat domain-containing protein, partial [Prochlorotrichaceae cyanobacterium]